MKKSLNTLFMIPAYILTTPHNIGMVSVDTGNLNIEVTTFLRDVAPAVGIENRSDKVAQCTATFNSWSELPQTRRAAVEPGKAITLFYPANHYHTVRVDIDVNCSVA
jgi:hypothetical protein